MSQGWVFLAEGRSMSEAKSAAAAALAELGLTLDEVPDEALVIDVGRGSDGLTYCRIRLWAGWAAAGDDFESE